MTKENHVDDRQSAQQDAPVEGHGLGLSQGETHQDIQDNGDNHRVQEMDKRPFH